MKTNIIVLIVFLLSISFSGCNNNDTTSGKAGTNRSIDNPIDDNLTDRANTHLVHLNVEVTGDLEVSNEIDYFKFILNEQTTVDFETQSVYGLVGQASIVKFEIYNNSNNHLAGIVSGSETETHFITLDSGIYYIKITTAATLSSYNEVSGYRFIFNGVEGIVIQDDYPDNSVNAHELDLNVELTGVLEVINDIDYFKFTLSKETTVEFENRTSLYPGSNRIDFTVYDKDDNQLLKYTNPNTKKYLQTFDTGTYYIRVATLNRNETTSYMFILNAVEGTVLPDDYSNNSKNAHVIDLNVEVAGSLEVSNDIDYFKFTLNQKTTIEFNRPIYFDPDGSIEETNEIDFAIYNNKNNQLELFKNFLNKILTLDAGTYFIKITTANKNISEYKFILNATDGTFHSDDYSNDKENAYVIDLNLETLGDLEVSNDKDYFKFTLNQQTAVEFEKQATIGNVGQASYSYFDVYDSSNKSLVSALVTSTTSTHTLPLEAGTYYIKVNTVSIGNGITGYRFILNAQ